MGISATSLKNYSFAIALVVICVAVWLAGDAVTELTQYDRTKIAIGELWRLLTAHITHLNASHLFLNLAGLALAWILFGTLLNISEWLLVYFVSSIGVSAGVWFFNPEITWYVGLSGTLHGFFIAGALVNLTHRKLESSVFLVVVAGKVIWEQLMGPLPGSEESAGGPVLVDAHFYGAIGGIIGYLVVTAIRNWRS